MSVGERDLHTGHMTTGHEWNGIIELNRPVPKIIWLFLAATVLFSVVYWVLMPAWPSISGYTKGLLGTNQTLQLQESMERAAAQQAAWREKVENRDVPAIMADDALMPIVREAGRPLFEDNCGACHGLQGQGGDGYPRLTDDSWLWGGSAEAVMETIRVGINSTNDGTRIGQMQAYGAGGLLNRNAILDVIAYVQTLSGGRPVGGDFVNGKEVFTQQCVACHGEDGTGLDQFGAPDLTDDFWIYGGDRASLFETVFYGRQGHMPHWQGRLSDAQMKILTAFVLDLGPSDGSGR